MRYVSIDQSLSSTAMICFQIDEKLNLQIDGVVCVGKDDCQVGFVQSIKKYKKNVADNVECDKYERNVYTCKRFVDIAKKYGAVQAIFESNSFGSVGMISDIAEYTGLFKGLFILNNIKLTQFTPKEVKAFAGCGSNNKNDMEYELQKRYPEIYNKIC